MPIRVQNDLPAKQILEEENIFIMDETQTILGAGCAASTKLVYPDGKISRIHNYKFPYEYIRSFDKLMEKKEEVTECLKKIRSVQPR